MTTGLSYDGTVSGTTSYVTQIATMAVVAETDPAFLTILPQMITYAENRMYRDIDFMFTSTSLHGTTFVLTPGNRNLSFNINLSANTDASAGTFVVSEQINLLTDASGNAATTTNPDECVRYPLLPTTKEFLDAVYGSSLSANRGKPQYFVPFNETLFFVGPVPDQAYPVEVVGTYRPNSLSSTNLTTFISLYLPDLFIMASMIYVSAYQRNFGRANDDPQMAVSYESQYQSLLKSAVVEEARKKFDAAGWSSQSPATVATPSRG
jgi:hypothetical protein